MQAITLESDRVLFLQDVMVGVFRQLPIKDLEKAVLVCKSWYAIASEHFIWNAPGIKKAMPNAKMVWIKDWEAEGISCDDVKPIGRRAAARDFDLLQSLDRNGFYLCGIVPQGLTLRKMEDIARKHGINLNFLTPPHAPDELMDYSKPSAYIVASTGYSLGGRRPLNVHQHVILSKIPDVSIITATAFAIFYAIHNKKCVYSDQSLHCSEEFHNKIVCIEYRNNSSEFLVNNIAEEMSLGGVGAQIVFK